MKTFAALFISILFFAGFCKGQTNEFAPIGAKWWYDHFYDINYADTSYDIGYVLIESVADTIINGINCIKLTSISVSPQGDVSPFTDPLFVFEDSGRVFCYSYDDSLFHTLYDFTGEDWYAYDFIYGSGDSVLIQVDSVSTIEIDGVFLNHIFPVYEPGSSLSFFSSVGERLGSLGYLFMYSGGDDSYYPFGLRCYEDFEITYSSDESIACDTLIYLNIDNNISETDGISLIVYGDEVIIKNEKNIDGELVIYNQMGGAVLKQKLEKTTILSMQQYSIGTYFITIQTFQNIYSYKILKL
jgi:hypothetical protein